MTFCHAARKGGNIGSHWPNPVRASALLDVWIRANASKGQQAEEIFVVPARIELFAFAATLLGLVPFA